MRNRFGLSEILVNDDNSERERERMCVSILSLHPLVIKWLIVRAVVLMGMTKALK